MKKQTQKSFCLAFLFLALFLLWTTAVRLIDVGAIGPQGSSVGFSALNGAFHHLTGVHLSLYLLTDWLSLIPLCIVIAFAIMGLWQWIKRKSLFHVDFSLLILGGFYIFVLSCYAFFEVAVVNYRPILIDGVLEPSYPSSTTMLVLCVLPTAMMQLHGRIKNAAFRRCVLFVLAAFTAFMLMGRLLSGVHWLSDIIGGALLSAGLVLLYHAASGLR